MKFNKIKGISKKTNKEYKMIIFDPNLPENKIVNWFEQRDKIKKYGGKWNKFKKFYYWFYNDDNLKELLETKIKPMIREAMEAENFESGKIENTLEDIVKFIAEVDEIADGLNKIPTKKISVQRVENLKEKLEEFKETLMNLDNDEDFKEIMLKLVKVRDLQGQRYSPYNALLILYQKPNAEWVKSKTDWYEYNRTIKPDANGIILVRPAGTRKITKKSPKYNEIIKPYLEKYGVKYFKDLPPGVKTGKLKDELFIPTMIRDFDYYLAYDVSETEQIPGKHDYYEEYKNSKPKWFGIAGKDENVKYIYNAILKYLDEVGIKVVFKTRKDMNGAFARSLSGTIEIQESDGTDIDVVGSLLHELGHELLHQEYLSRKDPFYKKFYIGKPARDIKELQAETIAWIVLELYGFHMAKKSSLAYNMMWGGTKEGMLKTFDAIKDVINHLVDIINDRLTMSEAEGGGISPAHHIDGEDVAKFLGVDREYKEAEKEYDVDNVVNDLSENIMKYLKKYNIL